MKKNISLKTIFQAEDTKRLLSNFFSLSALQGLNYILPIITLPYLIKVLGAEYFGLLAFANATIAYLVIITDYGFNLTATREISIYRKNNKKIIEIFSVVLIIKILLMCLCFILLSIIVCSFDKFSKNYEIYFYTFGTVIGQVLFPIWFFQGMETMKYITYLNILARTIFTIAIFIFVKDQEDFYIVPILSSLGFVVASILSLIIVKTKFNVGFEWQKKDILIKYFKDSWNVFLIDFMPNLYNNFSTFLLGFFTSMEMLGYYSLATKIVNIFNSFIYVVRNTTYPYLSNNSSKFGIISKLTIFLGLLFSFTIICLSNNLFFYIFGDIMQKSLLLIYILALSPFFLSITITFGSNKLLVLKKDREMKNITYIYSIFGFVLALSIIPIYGAIGAAYTLVITRGLTSCLTFIKARSL